MTATVISDLLDFGGSLNLKTGLPWRAAFSAVAENAAAAGCCRWRTFVDPGFTASSAASCAALPMQSEEQNVPCAASSRQSAQTALLQRSQLATAGVSVWLVHGEPMARHLVPSATMGIGSPSGAGAASSEDEEGEGPSSKMESIFWTALPPEADSAA